MNSNAVNFLKSCQFPGVLPQIYEASLKEVGSPNTPLAKISKVLSTDPVITARVLQHANTSIKRGKTAIGDISQAMTVLGLGQIRLILNELTTQSSTPDGLDDLINLRDFWIHSIAVATASEIIDRSLGGNSDEIYAAGLLHDFGRLIMLLNTDKVDIVTLAANCIPSKELLYKHERKNLGFNHMELTEALFTQWNMAAAIFEAATFHHSPKLAIRCRYETSVVHIASIICHSMQLGNSGTPFVPVLDTAALRFLDLNLDSLDYICEETSHQVEDRLNLYSI